MPERLTLPDLISIVVAEWPHWSRAERRRLDDLTAEIIDHCANGTGNPFVRAWCDRYLFTRPEWMERVGAWN